MNSLLYPVRLVGGPGSGARLGIVDAGELTVWNPHTGHAVAYELTGRRETGAAREIRGLLDGRLAVLSEHGVHLIIR